MEKTSEAWILNITIAANRNRRAVVCQGAPPRRASRAGHHLLLGEIAPGRRQTPHPNPLPWGDEKRKHP